MIDLIPAKSDGRLFQDGPATKETICARLPLSFGKDPISVASPEHVEMIERGRAQLLGDVPNILLVR